MWELAIYHQIAPFAVISLVIYCSPTKYKSPAHHTSSLRSFSPLIFMATFKQASLPPPDKKGEQKPRKLRDSLWVTNFQGRSRFQTQCSLHRTLASSSPLNFSYLCSCCSYLCFAADTSLSQIQLYQGLLLVHSHVPLTLSPLYHLCG